MENIVESILIGFAVLVFIIALSMTTYLLSTAMSTTEILIYNSDKTNYLDNISVPENNIPSRQVGIDTVINSLYRYYKENFMVKIYKKNSLDKYELVQIFDTEIEGKVYVAASKPAEVRDEEEKALIKMYGNSTDSIDLFGAPWVGNTEIFAKQRVDLYVSGQNGYINNGPVSYEDSGLFKLFNANTVFTETFVEYMYSGQTISTATGIETITGNTKEKNKIIIEYRAQN